MFQEHYLLPSTHDGAIWPFARGYLKPRHFHAQLEFLVMLRGWAKVRVGRSLHAVHAGQLVWHLPGVEHAIDETSADCELRVVHVEPDLCARVQRELGDLKNDMAPYEREYTRVVRKFKAGRPGASCMIMSLIDHAARLEGAVRTRSIVPRLVSSQRKVALEQGCAFFDTFTAMGGMNSFARWLRARPQLGAPDLAHPTLAGQGVIATLVYRALMHEYAAYRRKNAGAPLPELDTATSDGRGAVSPDGAEQGSPEQGPAEQGSRDQGKAAEPMAADAGAPASR